MQLVFELVPEKCLKHSMFLLEESAFNKQQKNLSLPEGGEKVTYISDSQAKMKEKIARINCNEHRTSQNELKKTPKFFLSPLIQTFNQ